MLSNLFYLKLNFSNKFNSEIRKTHFITSFKNQQTKMANFSLVVVALSVLIGLGGYFLAHNNPLVRLDPPTDASQHHHHFTLQKVWSKEAADKLMVLIKSKTFKLAAEDSTSSAEHAGEAQPLNAKGGCDHPFMLPSRDRSLCVFPSRIDIARHFLFHGGVAGHKETYEKLVARMLSFSTFFFDKFDELDELFKNPSYNENAQKVCSGFNVFDPIQLGVIMALPGQEVGMHLDVPYFYGASRFSLPQWLLMVMQFSGLWKEWKIPQVQGVAYVHQWNYTGTEGGDFFYYPNGPGGKVARFPPKFNTAIILDGSEAIHGVDTFKPDREPPMLLKDNKNELKFNHETSQWNVLVNNHVALNVSSNDLRMSFVWRQRCFESEEKRLAWKNWQQNLTVDDVLSRLEQDLINRKIITKRPEKALDFALLLLKEYIRMPFPENTAVPFNYCIAEQLAPSWSKSVFKPLCGQMQAAGSTL